MDAIDKQETLRMFSNGMFILTSRRGVGTAQPLLPGFHKHPLDRRSEYSFASSYQGVQRASGAGWSRRITRIRRVARHFSLFGGPGTNNSCQTSS